MIFVLYKCICTIKINSTQNSSKRLKGAPVSTFLKHITHYCTLCYTCINQSIIQSLTEDVED